VSRKQGDSLPKKLSQEKKQERREAKRRRKAERRDQMSNRVDQREGGQALGVQRSEAKRSPNLPARPLVRRGSSHGTTYRSDTRINPQGRDICVSRCLF
jgi:hypothetical protein